MPPRIRYRRAVAAINRGAGDPIPTFLRAINRRFPQPSRLDSRRMAQRRIASRLAIDYVLEPMKDDLFYRFRNSPEKITRVIQQKRDELRSLCLGAYGRAYMEDIIENPNRRRFSHDGDLFRARVRAFLNSSQTIPFLLAFRTVCIRLMASEK